MGWKGNLCMSLAVLVYLIFGGVVFLLLEGKHEKEMRLTARGYVSEFLRKFI